MNDAANELMLQREVGEVAEREKKKQKKEEEEEKERRRRRRRRRRNAQQIGITDRHPILLMKI